MDSRCPLKLKQLPCSGCPLGENLFQTPVKKHKRCSCKNPIIENTKTMLCEQCSLPLLTCHWGINSEYYNYCLWTYLSTEEGSVAITDTQIAVFVDLTVQRVGQIKSQSVKFLHDLYGDSLKKYLIFDPL